MDDVFMPFDGDQYNKGILLQEYNGTFYLVSAHGGNDGKIYADWCFPQGRDRKASEKALPWKIKIGENQDEAFKTLAFFGKILKPKV